MSEQENTVASQDSVTQVAAEQPKVQTTPVVEQTEQQKIAELPSDQDVVSEPVDYSNETHFDEDEDYFTDGEPEQTPLPETAEADEEQSAVTEVTEETTVPEPVETVSTQSAKAVSEPTPATAKEELPSQSMIDNVNERIKNEVKEDYIPNTKEFRDGVRKEAKQAVMDELGTDEFDPYDDEQQILFLEKAQQISQRRTNAYNAAVNKFQDEYRQREYEVKQQNFRNDLDRQVRQILNTPEKLKALDAAIDGISHKEFKRIQGEIINGKGDGLIKLAKAVASKMSITQPAQQKRQTVTKPIQPARKESNDDYVTEEFFGW